MIFMNQTFCGSIFRGAKPRRAIHFRFSLWVRAIRTSHTFISISMRVYVSRARSFSRHFYLVGIIRLISGLAARCVAQLKSITPVSHPHRPPRSLPCVFIQQEKSARAQNRVAQIALSACCGKSFFSLGAFAPPKSANHQKGIKSSSSSG